MRPLGRQRVFGCRGGRRAGLMQQFGQGNGSQTDGAIAEKPAARDKPGIVAAVKMILTIHGAPPPFGRIALGSYYGKLTDLSPVGNARIGFATHLLSSVRLALVQDALRGTLQMGLRILNRQRSGLRFIGDRGQVALTGGAIGIGADRRLTGAGLDRDRRAARIGSAGALVVEAGRRRARIGRAGVDVGVTAGRGGGGWIGGGRWGLPGL